MSTKISRFTERCVWACKKIVDDWDEPAAPEGSGGFADYAMISLHCLRIYLDTTYRMMIDLLTEMPQITREIGREPADLPHPSTLCLAFDRIEMDICRVLLRQSAQLHDIGDLAALDASHRRTAHPAYCELHDIGDLAALDATYFERFCDAAVLLCVVRAIRAEDNARLRH